jgi:hypothetical protein
LLVPLSFGAVGKVGVPVATRCIAKLILDVDELLVAVLGARDGDAVLLVAKVCGNCTRGISQDATV